MNTKNVWDKIAKEPTEHSSKKKASKVAGKIARRESTLYLLAKGSYESNGLLYGFYGATRSIICGGLGQWQHLNKMDILEIEEAGDLTCPCFRVRYEY